MLLNFALFQNILINLKSHLKMKTLNNLIKNLIIKNPFFTEMFLLGLLTAIFQMLFYQPLFGMFK